MHHLNCLLHDRRDENVPDPILHPLRKMFLKGFFCWTLFGKCSAVICSRWTCLYMGRSDPPTAKEEPPTCEAETSTADKENCRFTKPWVSRLTRESGAKDTCLIIGGGAVWATSGPGVVYSITEICRIQQQVQEPRIRSLEQAHRVHQRQCRPTPCQNRETGVYQLARRSRSL